MRFNFLSGYSNVEKQINYSYLRTSTYVVHVLLYVASKTWNPLTVWGEIPQTMLVKNEPDIFRIKSLVF